jgi:hypothetical protein
VSTETRYWFRAKRYGWGLMPRRPFLFTMVLAAMTVLFVAICYLKGEPLSGGSKIQ